MNIFIEAQKFYVRTQLHTLIDADARLLSLASEIRRKLGERAFKFDEYLTTILSAANLRSVQQAFEDADEDFSALRRVCVDIIDDKHELCGHAYYPALKACIDEYRPRLQDRYTLVSMACAAAAPLLMERMARKHFDGLEDAFRGLTDIVELRQLYRELTYAAGEQDVDRLNELIQRRFFIAAAGDAYLQALTEQYLLELLHHDKESGRRVIQIMLDNCAAEK